MKKVLLCLCCYVSYFACIYAQDASHFQKAYINPANGYTQVVAVTTGNIKTLYVSGQVGEGEDMKTQIRSAFHNLEKQLKDAGATLDDLVKTTTFFVNYQPEHLSIFKEIRKELLGDHNMPASTLVGVQALAAERLLVEIEAVAVIEIR